MLQKKSLTERIVHALGFEFFALLLCAPTIALVMDKPLMSAGLLTLAISVTATLWNMLYNVLFDRLQNRVGFQRTPLIRMLHALGFEGGLILAVVPMAAWWLSIGLVEAFLMEVGLLVFLLPYTYLYNLGFDRLRERYLARQVDVGVKC
ncbi:MULTISPECIES: multidrug/biocide efflux PACE transporter [unclassified Pseudomonas]|uniref:multidrug/biocide efflux PACE transporter n=1 Tax=unclassified Pseudomonas TaxID=196821 RepID=UPI0021C90CE3|nr:MULTISPECIES: multidrug/biocide efflux PACE transporter [unclassified Pseudomonas]MCU1734489.1 multidrug/biocide efflux PACE transporter [Pseudomonas sp. 20P_3.2_Bac4]MCU1745534.1 multidrug/biocide efflux PACE transporter [Pseudomonas sp. 20P_3.2_Bac5]